MEWWNQNLRTQYNCCYIQEYTHTQYNKQCFNWELCIMNTFDIIKVCRCNSCPSVQADWLWHTHLFREVINLMQKDWLFSAQYHVSCWYCGNLSGGWFNIKMTSYQYRKSHCGDKTILRLSYLHIGISYTGKTTSLYWIGVLVCWCNYSPITQAD